MSKTSKYFFIIVLFLSYLAITFYLCVRIIYFLIVDYEWYEKVFALLLLIAETFVIIHTLGYFLNIAKVLKHGIDKQPEKMELSTNINYYPSVAIVVASYKEPLSILRDTLICFYNLSYPNKHLYLLDDTRYELPWDTEENKEKYKHEVEELCKWVGVNLFRSKWHGAKAGKLNDFLQYLSGKPRPDFQVFEFEQKKKSEAEKYLLVFDADMNPFPDFVEELVGLMESKPRAAFIQTPQYYSNFRYNRVAKAAGLQQAIFYEYICEGKGLKDAMFCCGTNVLYRREALMDVGGFDETSVTEDFATSLKFHSKGWVSIYLNRVSAFGMGPEDLGGYFKQQFRWATGTTGLLRKLPAGIIKNFHRIPMAIWWEYFLSCTHYFVGWVFFLMVLAPVMYLFFNVPSYFSDPFIYLIAYLPYIVITSFTFYMTLRSRRYQSLDLASALLINAVSFPVYMKATAYALLGVKTSFGVTPKGGSAVISLRDLIPQIALALLCIAAIVWGILRIYYEREPFYGLAVNTFWASCNFFFISFVLYFNHSEARQEA